MKEILSLAEKGLTSKPIYMKRLENLSFSEASAYAKKGFAIQRKGWNALNQFISYTESRNLFRDELWGKANKQHFKSTTVITVEGYYTLKTVRETINVGWQPVIADLETNDWQVVDPITYEVIGYFVVGQEGDAE